ncbi:DUF4249 domain-containing protein [Hymenobacter taeanensis]|uniref:DUF4249 domain-containing protein n=1 Tax=Hymenobacter taeanensis TaxID=2735321 RepID=A0A6M6BD40_9BACT|nr:MULTISPECIES: DUF4249 domain-containing protein [Hymenobacter]QJX45919.1 DUF4249 domain-containing protein [Hymenobacter taeanensis]UOQ79765.1 DUF4249 domain-containing protein [Hymenobacter sp. 5414T-23]
MNIWLRVYAIMLALLVGSCIEPFEPKVADAPSSYLVVDGAISTQGVSTIRLSRTLGLGQGGKAPVEGKARVYIEEASGRQYPLTEGPVGTYSSAALSLTAETGVRLHFTTSSGREYVSDYTPAKYTPPIDSVSWKIGDQGLQIYVNAHDETNATRYFRWSYEETWEFRSRYASYLEYKNKKLVDRQEDINHCWGQEAPSTITLGNTVRLSRNVVSEQPITLLPERSTKLITKYSILVRQYALSLEEYTYWEALRKNTESIGTLFDPLPTQLTGNVHNLTDASEEVLGFVGAQSVVEQRIFIDRSDLPPSWPRVTGYESCPLDTATSEDLFADGKYTPIAMDKAGIYYSTTECIDCRKRGVNVRPSFWK